jgi:hypothetical protein
MDAQRFDTLARLLAQPRSRRTLAGLVAGVLAGSGAAAAAARTKRKPRRKTNTTNTSKKKARSPRGGDRDRRKQGKSRQQSGEPKVTICHCPPGNPDNCHTIHVGAKAAATHLEHHPGDREGACMTTTTAAPTTTTTAAPTTTTAAPTTTTAAPTTTTTPPPPRTCPANFQCLTNCGAGGIAPCRCLPPPPRQLGGPTLCVATGACHTFGCQANTDCGVGEVCVFTFCDQSETQCCAVCPNPTI